MRNVRIGGLALSLMLVVGCGAGEVGGGGEHETASARAPGSSSEPSAAAPAAPSETSSPADPNAAVASSEEDGDSDAQTAIPETVELTTLVGKNAKVTAHDGLHLRSSPSTSGSIILTMPHGATVHVIGMSNGWYKVTYSGHTGWCSGMYLSAEAGGGAQTTPTGALGNAMGRARSGLGFSYHWGGGCWAPGSSAHGACYGNCPSCTHSGTYGADCSGYVSKVWQVPGTQALTTCSHPYSTREFYNTHAHWKDVARSAARQGDAFVHNNGSEGHIFIYDSGDRWGWMKAYEAKGCSWGILLDSRTANSTYKVIRRDGF